MKPIHLISAGCAMLSLFSLHPATAAPGIDDASAVMATLAYGPEDILRDTDYQMHATVLILPSEKSKSFIQDGETQALLAKQEARALKPYVRHQATVSVRDRIRFQDDEDRLRGSFHLDPFYLDEADIRCVTVEDGHAFLGVGHMKKGETMLLRNQGNDAKGKHIFLLVSFDLPDD